MKRYLGGLIALILAVSASAFTKIEDAKKVSLYWYHRDAADTYVDDGFGTNPNTSCSGTGNICAKGFTSSQDPALIKDNTMANQQRVKS